MEQSQSSLRGAPAFILLAAGLSRRMGRCKLALPWRGDTVLGTTIAQALAGGCQPLTVISGAYRAEVEAIAAAKGVACRHNPDYATGQASSLRCGLAGVAAGQGVMFLLGDQPLIPPTVYAALRQAYQQSAAWLVAPCDAAGKRGNPVIIAPELSVEVAALTGDAGARGLFARYEAQTLLVPLGESGIALDIDSPEDYRRLQAGEENQ